MKKLLVVLALVVAPLSAAAATEISDILLSSTGTLYTIASEKPGEGSGSAASTHLVLTERTGDVTKTEIVPASKVRGNHLNSLLGYDSESGTLFVFWIQHFGYLYNELLLCTRDRNGNWSDATSFGSPYNYRENLRIAFTQKVADPDSRTPINGLTAHVTWWEFDHQTGRQAAQYRMLPIVNGHVADDVDVNLDEFLPYDMSTNTPDADPTVLKHPLLSAARDRNSVVLVFADARSGSFTQVRFTPTRGVASEGRIRIPVGKREGGYTAPRLSIGGEGRLEGVFGEQGRTAFYTISNGGLRYVMLRTNGWTEPRTITLDEQITSNAALSALQEMLAEQ